MKKEEFESLLKKYHQAAYRWSLTQCGYNESMAEDVLQDSYIKAFTKFDQFSNKSEIKTWIFQIIKNTAIDYHRRNSKEAGRQEHFQEDQFAQTAHQDKDLKSKKSLEYAQKIVASLSKREREVTELVIFSDLTLKEAASVLGITEGSASSYLKRAKKALKGEVIKSRQLNTPDFEHTITHLLTKKSA